MAAREQSFENHAKLVTGYHRVATGLMAAVLMWSLVRLATDFSGQRIMDLLFVVAVILIGFYTRTFALGVQDRVIRLEERLRMERLLPPDLQSRIGELTTNQLIALRFASEGELAELTRRVLDEGMTDRTEIKRAIRVWRPDHQRI